MGFHGISGGEAELQVNAVHPQEKGAAEKIIEDMFGIGPNYGRRTFPDHTTQLQDFNILMPKEFQRYIQSRSNDCQAFTWLQGFCREIGRATCRERVFPCV